eukprot:COSAG02_NODE_13347_length_1406_cov_1.892119_2_plen_97_part_00
MTHRIEQGHDHPHAPGPALLRHVALLGLAVLPRRIARPDLRVGEPCLNHVRPALRRRHCQRCLGPRATLAAATAAAACTLQRAPRAPNPRAQCNPA